MKRVKFTFENGSKVDFGFNDSVRGLTYNGNRPIHALLYNSTFDESVRFTVKELHHIATAILPALSKNGIGIDCKPPLKDYRD